MSKTETHGGHRERLRRRLETQGMDGFEPHEILELILFYSIPRVNTNPIAHRLLDKFGSLSAVLEAPRSELVKVEGVGQTSATLLSMIPEIARRYMQDKNDVGIVLDSPKKTGEYIKNYFIGVNNEKLYIMCFDKKAKLLNCGLLAEGSFDSVTADIRLICKAALDCGACSIALAHNHSKGFAIPSADDIAVTFEIAKSLKTLSIEVVDHIIVARDDFVSMAESGIIANFKL